MIRQRRRVTTYTFERLAVLCGFLGLEESQRPPEPSSRPQIKLHHPFYSRFGQLFGNFGICFLSFLVALAIKGLQTTSRAPALWSAR